MKYEGQEPANVRRCDIERLKKKLAKARHDRDEWRKRAEDAERILREASRDVYARDAAWLHGQLQSEIVRLKEAIVRSALDGAKEN